MIIDLKQTNLEEAMVEADISPEKRIRIKRELQHFDEYYLTSSGEIISVFQQEFVSDPYLQLPSLPQIRLVNYESGANLGDLEKVFDKSDLPIITRIKESKLLPDFDYLLNKRGEKTKLFPIKIYLPSVAKFDYFPNIRPMDQSDLPTIEELFRREYSLRRRMVELMWEESPETCFVYECDKNVLGVTFNRIDKDKFYMRQIFVKEGHRGKGVGRDLYQQKLEFARRHGLKFASGNIREETEIFHRKFNSLIEEKLEYYIIRGYIQ